MEYAQIIAEKREADTNKTRTSSPTELPRLQWDDAVWRCPDCGANVEPITFEIVTGNARYIRRQFCACPDGRRKKADAEEQTTYEEWRAQAAELIRPIDVGAYGRYRFGEWERKAQAGNAALWADTVEQYADTVQDNTQNWLYLYGDYGVGKTHLAVSALRKAAAVRLWKPHIIVWPSICALTKESWGNAGGATEGSLWAAARNAKIALIDDLDKTASSEWTLGKLYTLIDYRVTRQKPTIITANHSLTELQKMWKNDTWQAVLSRIVGQLTMTVKMYGVDQRGQR